MSCGKCFAGHAGSLAGSAAFTIDRLVARYAPDRTVLVTFTDEHSENVHAGGYQGRRLEDGRYRFTLPADDAVPTLMASLAEKHAIRDLTVAEPALEDVIKQIYARAEPGK